MVEPSVERIAPGPDAPVKLAVQNLTAAYDGVPVLRDVSLEVRENEIFGIIGPANSGKTTFLRTLNRMDEEASNLTVPAVGCDGFEQATGNSTTTAACSTCG